MGPRFYGSHSAKSSYTTQRSECSANRAQCILANPIPHRHGVHVPGEGVDYFYGRQHRPPKFVNTVRSRESDIYASYYDREALDDVVYTPYSSTLSAR